MQRRGALTADGDFATLVFERVYRHAPQNVWDAIATPEGLREWLLCTEALVEGRVGGRIELVSGAAGYRSTGRILVWQPPRVLEYEWKVAPVAEMPRGEDAIFRWELTANGDATNVLVTYRRITKETARGFLPGLHAFLDRLDAQLDAREMPDFVQRFGELRAHYPEWNDHAPDTRQ